MTTAKPWALPGSLRWRREVAALNDAEGHADRRKRDAEEDEAEEHRRDYLADLGVVTMPRFAGEKRR